MSETTPKPSAARKTLSTIVAIVAAIGGYAASQYFLTKSPEQKAAELAAALSDVAARENPGEPRDMGDGTKLLSVKAGQDEIVYTYSVPSNLETEARYGGALRDERLRNAVCSSPAKALVQAGGDFVYVYVKEGTGEELSRSTVYLCV